MAPPAPPAPARSMSSCATTSPAVCWSLAASCAWAPSASAMAWAPTPLREALSRLSAEGLVARTDQRGFSVAALNWDELPVLTRNRVQLESLALAESIEHRDAAWETPARAAGAPPVRTPLPWRPTTMCPTPTGRPCTATFTAACWRAVRPAGYGPFATAWPTRPPVPPAGRRPGVQLPQRACRACGHL